LGLLPVLRRLERRRNSLKILAYHRVLDVDLSTYPFDKELIDATPEEFDRQLHYISRNYQILPLGEAVDRLKAGLPVSDVLVLTFDDGFDDLYHTIFPILKKHQVPATIFLASGLIGTSDTLWSEEIVYALKTSVGKSFVLPALGFVDTQAIKEGEVDGLISRLLRDLKLKSDGERQALATDLFDQLKLELPVNAPESRMLTWDMVREMQAWGVEFGAHSVTHSVLSNLPEKEMIIELHDSKRKIEAETGAPCTTMAYPVGGEDAFNRRIIEEVQRAGYSVACSYLSGVNYSDCLHPYSLRRIHVDRTVNFDWFKSEIAFPALCAADFYRE